VKDGLCPKCGARTVYMRQNKANSYGMGSIPLGGTIISQGAPADDYVCVSCGYVEVYISDSTRLDYISENWRRVEGPDSSTDTRHLPPLGK
jgi:hypothetical protein